MVREGAYLTLGAAVLSLVCFPAGPVLAKAETIRVASTTSTEASGLFGYILPQFTRKTGIAVRVVAVGTGQAIRLARRGDVDVLLVHHKPSEEKFLREGYGLRRHPLMFNDFVIVGPERDPAKVKEAVDVTQALMRIRDAMATFLSRGDDSGTHKRERRLWRTAGVNPSVQQGWYREIGAGMGRTLNIAATMPAYTLVDRGTWLSFANRRSLVLLFEGDYRLRNPYGVIVVNPQKHPHVNVRAAQSFVRWLVSPAGQRAIGSFRIDGKVLFYPLARSARP